MTTQLNVRLPDMVIAEINELAEEYGSQAKVIIAAVSKLRNEIEMRKLFTRLKRTEAGITMRE